MRRLFLYLRQCFCKHDFLANEKMVEERTDDGHVYARGIKVSIICKKCGYHNNFWKYNKNV